MAIASSRCTLAFKPVVMLLLAVVVSASGCGSRTAIGVSTPDAAVAGDHSVTALADGPVAASTPDAALAADTSVGHSIDSPGSTAAPVLYCSTTKDTFDGNKTAILNA